MYDSRNQRFRSRSHSAASIEQAADVLTAWLNNALNVSLVGAPGAGKTRVLRELEQRAGRRRASRTPVVYLDFAAFRDAGQEEFFDQMGARLLTKMAEAHELVPSRRSLSTDEASAFLRAKVLVKWRNKEELRTIFLLDHLDECDRNPAFDTAFFSALRSLASLPRVAFVCASSRELHQLARIEHPLSSPFYNVFVSCFLAPG